MHYHRILIGVLLVTFASAPAYAEDPRWSLSSSFNYSTGDYGTGKDTTLIYIPVTLGVTPIERFTASLTVPYIRQSTQTVVVTGRGRRA